MNGGQYLKKWPAGSRFSSPDSIALINLFDCSLTYAGNSLLDDEVVNFNEKLLKNYASLSDYNVLKTLNDKSLDMGAIQKEVKRVNQVFDQKSLMAGTGLLLKIMRQFESVYEKKSFYLVKNGAVGWITAYVNQNSSN